MSSLTGLVANYGDSDEEHDYGPNPPRTMTAPPAPTLAAPGLTASEAYDNPTIQPPPISHCPWSACYDESSGFTYYWNQHTNAVTWEAPPEYLLALKVAQQHLHSQGSAEVSAEEWQLYQQALAEKQISQYKSNIIKSINKSSKKSEIIGKLSTSKDKKQVRGKKRQASDDEDEKIELITSYHNSDSESNDDSESSSKSALPKPSLPGHVTKVTKSPSVVPKPKKQKKQPPPKEYGPTLPPNQNYTMPIGPELPAIIVDSPKMPVREIKVNDEVHKSPMSNDYEDTHDENILLKRLKDKAKLLEKLGGEIPSELKDIIKDELSSGSASPAVVETKKTADIDDLLAEIEKKELPKVKTKVKKCDIFDDDSQTSAHNSARNSPRSNVGTPPPREDIKPLFPSSKVIESDAPSNSLLPNETISTVQQNGVEGSTPKSMTPPPPPPPEKKPNLYLSDASEFPTTTRKKFRISNSVLPERPKPETPSYTTKYSAHIEGFSSERTGLGFSKDEETDSTLKPVIAYGQGLMFTKGETLNEEKKDEELDDLSDLVEAKLKYLNQVQPCMVTPVQEMLLQMQTLAGAWRAGALTLEYWRRWVSAAARSLADQEASAAPAGWTCAFQRSSGRYQYVRTADGFAQWEYPLPPADMDISTTPPHQGSEQEIVVNPPLPTTPPPPPPPPSPPPRARTPPPPAWHDPPPPGTDEPPPLPAVTAHTHEPKPPKPKQEIGDELASFYSDLAELEKTAPPAPSPPPRTPPPPPAAPTPPPPPPPPAPAPPALDHDDKRDKEKHKKKSKVKISSSIGMKHKSVSSLVAKWQQVAEEINSD